MLNLTLVRTEQTNSSLHVNWGLMSAFINHANYFVTELFASNAASKPKMFLDFMHSKIDLYLRVDKNIATIRTLCVVRR